MHYVERAANIRHWKLLHEIGPEYTIIVVNHNMPVIETFHTLM